MSPTLQWDDTGASCGDNRQREFSSGRPAAWGVTALYLVSLLLFESFLFFFKVGGKNLYLLSFWKHRTLLYGILIFVNFLIQKIVNNPDLDI